MAMRIAELVGLKKFRVADGPEPQPGPGEVLVQVAAVGICGSDMHYYAEGGIGDSRVKYPVVLGHEPAGVVLRTGANVSGIEPGDHFALECVFNGTLVAFVIDETDEVDVAIIRDVWAEVARKSIDRAT